LPRNQKPTKLIAGCTIKVATIELGAVLVLFDDQSNMKIKTTGAATVPPRGKVKSVHEAKAKFIDGYKQLIARAHSTECPSSAPR
jgi:hypothetical protein